MILTEEQARGKWCPFARNYEAQSCGESGGIAAAAVNRTEPMSDIGPRCIASQCMAWRWRKTEAWQYPDGRVIETNTEPARGGGYWVKLGYCGLAGQVTP